MAIRSRLAAVLGVLVAGAALTACVPVPVPELVVNVSTDGGDAVPGDGVCEVTPGQGDCTLRAAIGEGNALGRARITVPDLLIDSGPDLPFWYVTGHLSISGDPTARVAGAFYVEVGGSLQVQGLRTDITSTLPPRVLTSSFVVYGTLVLGRSSIGSIEVGDGAIVLAQNSVIAGIANDGAVSLRHVTLHGFEPLVAGPDATTHVASSLLQPYVLAPANAPVCQGTPPVSGGYNIARDVTCGLEGPGDVEGEALATHDVALNVFLPSGPALDRIPEGVNGCGTEVTVDLGDFAPIGGAGPTAPGMDRPTDSTGSGTPACDVGAREAPAGP